MDFLSLFQADEANRTVRDIRDMDFSNVMKLVNKRRRPNTVALRATMHDNARVMKRRVKVVRRQPGAMRRDEKRPQARGVSFRSFDILEQMSLDAELESVGFSFEAGVLKPLY